MASKEKLSATFGSGPLNCPKVLFLPPRHKVTNFKAMLKKQSIIDNEVSSPLK